MSTNALALFPELTEQPNRTTGLLPSHRLEELVCAGHLKASSPILPDQIQPCSIDLRLGARAYQVRASFLPNQSSTVHARLADLLVRELDLSKPTLLARGSVYIVPLQEELFLPDNFSGKANPKSSTGRLDVFTRLITDYGNTFEDIRPGYRGKLYAEIVPLTFPVVVREGVRLNQLRIRLGNPPPSDKMISELHEREPIVYFQDESPAEPLISKGLNLSVSLLGIGSEIIGYRARRHAPPIDLSKVNYYDVAVFWEPLYRNSERSIVLQPGEFYIVASKEKVSIPPHMAAEMLTFDPSFGEFRVHYAGFFDPGFGWNPQRPTGSHAVLEVRSHEVPSLIEDGQVVARLNYEPLLAPPAKLYGQGIGSSYQSQSLTLGKHFKKIDPRPGPSS
ncbi:MAG TPA: 2'-deoxycytidine 5'-triphosphate deaminase [Bryobacteraceae bacterium]